MNSLLSKIKSTDYKQFLVDHGEKIGFGTAVLLVVTVLALSNRNTYPKDPSEFRSKAEAANTQMMSSKWPDSHRNEKFALVEFTKEREVRLARLDDNAFRYIVEMSPKLYPREAQLKEPVRYAVEDLKVYSGRTVVYIQETPATGTSKPAEDETVAKADSPPKPKAGNRDFAEEFGSDTPKAASQGTTPAVGPPGGVLPPPTGVATSPMPPGATAAMMDPYAGGAAGMMPGGLGNSRHGRGMRYNSVVGIVPHKKMMESFKAALHTPSPERAASFIQYVDFRIERQMAVAGPDPWTGPWQKLDIGPVLDALSKEWDGWDEDPVSVLVTDPVFTMPLPPRAMGSWKTHGSHPRLQAYLLSQEELEKDRKKNEEAALLLSKKEEREKKGGGFAVAARDLGQARRVVDSMAANTPGMGAFTGAASGQMPGTAIDSQAMMAKMQGSLPGANVTHNSASMLNMANMSAASVNQAFEAGPANTSEMLLFRYIDFEIEPGQTYRYRVQLTLNNPNFGKPPEQLETLLVGEGKTLETPMSDPSPPVTVEKDVDYFLTRVPRRSGKPAGGAQLDVIQWDTTLGTLEKGANLVVNYGQNIGGSVRTDRLDVVGEKLEERVEVPIFGQDILVDSVGAPGGAVSDLPDLKLQQRELAAMSDGGTLDEALTVDATGNLVVNSKHATVEQLQLANSRYAAQMDAYKELRETKEEDDGKGGSLDALVASSDPYAKSKGKDKKKRALNPANPMMMYAGGAMPGMVPGGAAPGLPAAPGAGNKAKTKPKR